MPDLAPYVHVNPRTGELVNTVSGKALPVDAGVGDLERGGFLAHQSKDFIRAALASFSKIIKVFVIPTWGCNLRCSFCFVLKELEGYGSDDQMNVEGFEAMIRHLLSVNPNAEKLRLTIIGGEPGKAPRDCLRAVEVATAACEEKGLVCKASFITNLSYELTEDHFKAFDLCEEIQVSLDGMAPNHNTFRKPREEKDLDVFKRVMGNLVELCQRGYAPKTLVHAALPVSVLDDDVELQRFIYMLRRLGIEYGKMNIGGIHNTDHFDNEMNPDRWIQRRFFPCCVYLDGQYLACDSTGVYLDYFKRRTWIGTYAEAIERFEEERGRYIDESPFMQDPNCMRCPAVARCWGGCVENTRMRGRPSEFCDQDRFIRYVQDELERGVFEERDVHFEPQQA